MAIVAVASTTLLACATSAPASDAPPALIAHRDAVRDFQRLDLTPPGARRFDDRCLQRCDASDRACFTAATLCDDAPGSDACREARTGCSWTTSLLPARCDYCTTYPP